MTLALPCLGDVVADVGGKRRFSHARSAREDDEVGLLQAAHHAVEIIKAGGDAGQFPIALKGVRGHVDGRGQGLGEALETTVISACFGQFIKPSFGVFDLVARREIDRRVEGDIHHVLANLDQRAAHRKIVDRAAIVLGIDDRCGFRGEAGEVLAHSQAADVHAGIEKGLQRDRRCELAGADKVARKLVDLLMNRFEKMYRLEKVGNPVECLVVDEDRAQKRLLRLDIVRGRTVERGRFFDLLAGCRISDGHGCYCLPEELWHSTRFVKETRRPRGCPAIHKLD